jgi:uncharacterized protein (TIGR03067 family)
MRRLTAVALFVAMTCAAGRAQDDAKAAAKKLEGTYEVVSISAGGKADDKKRDEIKSFVIKDGMITVTSRREETAKFTVDPSKKPAHIDIDPGKDRTVQGIYEAKETAKGLELTIAFADGPNAERPKDFKGEAEKTLVIRLLRKK